MFSFNNKKINSEEELGNGSSGTIYPYQKGPLDKEWVVKHIVTNQAKDLCHHVNEIVLGFNCDHSNVLPIKGYFIDFDQQKKIWDIYIKLPRMVSSLKNIIEKHIRINKCIPEEVIVQYFYAATRGLQYLHGKGIAHRDIKSENLLLDKNNILKFADFGLGNLVSGESSYTVDKAGSRLYAAPEMLDQNIEIKKKDLFKADYWSLGMVMLELCNLDLRSLDSNSGIQKQDKMKQKADKLRGKYTNVLLDLIFSLLQLEPSKRRSLKAIQECLETNYRKIIHKGNDNGEAEIRDLKQTVKHLEKELNRRKGGFKRQMINLVFIIVVTLIINIIVPILSDGFKYVKEWKDNRNEGYSVLTLPNGDHYEGEFHENLRHGNGTLIYSDGSKYKGEWENDKREGRGIFTWPNGDSYEGQFNDNNMHGKGIRMYSNGEKYEGEWKNNMKEGQGAYIWPNGGRYEGEFHENLFHGKGTRIYSDRSKYKGEWKNNKREGQGIYTWTNGDRYEGEFHDDMSHGKGTQTFSDGRKYEGEWKYDRMQGHGIYTWPNGHRYIGEFLDDLRHGEGTLIYSDGRKYTGEWINDKKIGQGIFISPDGGLYEVEFD